MTPPYYINRYVSILFRYGQRYLSARLREYELDVGQMPFLMRVLCDPGITQDGIAIQTGMDKGTVARGVAQLEESGLIVRIPDERDRRCNRLWPTERALALKDTLFGIAGGLQDILCEGLSPEEREDAFRLIGHMAGNIRRCVNKK